MKEVSWSTPIEKAEFIFKREFMAMEHNYLCACCKERTAIQDTSTGVLHPCRICRKEWKMVRMNFIQRLLQYFS